jgi:dihydrofolate reductase
MSRLRVESFCLSLDGYGAAPKQDLDNPFGEGGMVLPKWIFPTATFMAMTGQKGGTTGIDDQFASRGFDGVGANIMGRNMFGPIRGAWTDDEWKGWWGPNPPYHSPVFVLTHHARKPLEMEGGTVFYFVTDGIESAFKQAQKAAGCDVLYQRDAFELGTRIPKPMIPGGGGIGKFIASSGREWHRSDELVWQFLCGVIGASGDEQEQRRSHSRVMPQLPI